MLGKLHSWAGRVAVARVKTLLSWRRGFRSISEVPWLITSPSSEPLLISQAIAIRPLGETAISRACSPVPSGPPTRLDQLVAFTDHPVTSTQVCAEQLRSWPAVVFA